MLAQLLWQAWTMASHYDEDSLDDAGASGSGSTVGGTDRTIIVERPTSFDHYQLERVLGRGGMGEVWQALDTKLERRVALKVMRRELLANEDAVRRFYREAKAVARLNHPNIVQVYSIGEEKEVIYFVMELVEGETVSQQLRRSGQLPLEECVRVLLQTVEGLGYAYDRGIIHRDIKPSNIMVTNDHRVKIADFGLAKMIEHDTQVTAAGTTMGSPNYMSPEQARGEEADHRSDIYALGITFYQMLMGQLPFLAETPLSVLLKQIQEPIPEPEPLRLMGGGQALSVIKKMTSKATAERYQSYAELARELAALAPGIAQQPSTYSPTSSMPTPSQGEPNEVPDSMFSAASTELKGQVRDRVGAGGVAGGAASPVQDATTASARRSSSRGGERNVPLLVAVGALALIGVILAVGAAWMLHGTAPNEAPPGKSVTVAHAPVTTPEPTVVPTPAVTPTPGLTPIVTAVSTPTGPIPGVVSAPDVAPTPVPTATPIAFSATEVVAGGRDAATGVAVPVFDESLRQIDTVPAGTRLPLEGLDKDSLMYRVQYRQRSVRVRTVDARLPYDQLQATPATAVSPGALPISVILGTKGGSPTEQISIWDDAGRREIQKLPSGTELRCVGETDSEYRVEMPNGRRGIVYKKTASPKK